MAFRDGPFENRKAPLAWIAGVVAVLVLIGMIVVLVAGARTPAATGSVRGGADAAASPVSNILSLPIRGFRSIGSGIGGYFNAVSENRRLRLENAELREWRDDAIAMKNINQRYEQLLAMRSQPPVALAAGRAVADARGPFANARLLDVGAAKGVRVGQPVIDEHGLVGRVTGVTQGASRVLMVTDVNSRIPVLVDRTNARGIMTGDGSANPRLSFVREGQGIQAGDRILTSGDGGGFPRGVPVGVVARGLDGSWRIKLYSDHGAIDFVRVMLFTPFGADIDPASLDAPPLTGVPVVPLPEPPLQPIPAEPTPAEGAPATGAAQTPATAATPARPAARPATRPAAARPQAQPPAAQRPAATAGPRPYQPGAETPAAPGDDG